MKTKFEICESCPIEDMEACLIEFGSKECARILVNLKTKKLPKRAEVETFKIQNSISCFREPNGCSDCMNETPCHWYLNFSGFLDCFDIVLQSFLGVWFRGKKEKFLIIKEGVITKL